MLSQCKKNNINIGIEILRFILCLWVVIIHCSYIKDEHRKILSRGFHVPTFILISFYFYFPLIYNRKIVKIISRFQRLLIPYIFWPILIFIINNVLEKTLSKGQFHMLLSLKEIYYQLLTGSQFHPIFWFLYNLLFLSIFLSIIAFILKKKVLPIIETIGIISLYLHFSGLNFNYFVNYQKHIKISIGGLIELMPNVVIGLIFGSINLLHKLNYFFYYHYFFMIALIFLLLKYDLFIYYPGFLYPNVLLNIVDSAGLFLLFGSLNLDNSGIFFLISRYVTKFTGGIYYMHPVIHEYLKQNYVKNQSYIYSIFIYIICYLICFTGNKLFKNKIFKYLFL